MKKILLVVLATLLMTSANAGYEVSYKGQTYIVSDHSYMQSYDGKQVWCGKKYMSSATSLDGKQSCRGGNYSKYKADHDQVRFLKEDVKGCAKYKRKDGTWSPSYRVKGMIIDGDSFNEWAKSKRYFSNYDEDNNYFVIFWNKGGYVALNIGNTKNSLFVERQTKDHRGRIWAIEGGIGACQ